MKVQQQEFFFSQRKPTETTGDDAEKQWSLSKWKHHLLYLSVWLVVLSQCLHRLHSGHHSLVIIPQRPRIHGGTPAADWVTEAEGRAHSASTTREKNTTKQNPAHCQWDTPTAPPPLPPTSLSGPSRPSHSGIKTTYCLSTIGVKDFLPSYGRRPGPTELQVGNIESENALRCLFVFCIMRDCLARWINDRQITPCDVSVLAGIFWWHCQWTVLH